jgi:hypothetical protein
MKEWFGLACSVLQVFFLMLAVLRLRELNRLLGGAATKRRTWKLGEGRRPQCRLSAIEEGWCLVHRTNHLKGRDGRLTDDDAPTQ